VGSKTKLRHPALFERLFGLKILLEIDFEHLFWPGRWFNAAKSPSWCHFGLFSQTSPKHKIVRNERYSVGLRGFLQPAPFICALCMSPAGEIGGQFGFAAVCPEDLPAAVQFLTQNWR
jgi:hypothetical protein